MKRPSVVDSEGVGTSLDQPNGFWNAIGVTLLAYGVLSRMVKGLIATVAGVVSLLNAMFTPNHGLFILAIVAFAYAFLKLYPLKELLDWKQDKDHPGK